MNSFTLHTQALDKLGVSYAGAGLLSEAKRAAVLHSKSSEVRVVSRVISSIEHMC